MMDPSVVQAKWAEAGSLVESVPASDRLAAQSAVMTALLIGEKPAASGPGQDLFSRPASAKITTVRQLSRYTSRKEVSAPEAAVLLAWFLRETESRGITAKDCRDNWAIIAIGAFTTTYLHRAEKKGLLNSAQKGGDMVWELTGDGYDVAVKLMADTLQTAKA